MGAEGGLSETLCGGCLTESSLVLQMPRKYFQSALTTSLRPPAVSVRQLQDPFYDLGHRGICRLAQTHRYAASRYPQKSSESSEHVKLASYRVTSLRNII